MSTPCPCGLSYEALVALPQLVGPGGRCTAEDQNGNTCGRRLADHPHQQPQQGTCISFFII
jgi:hypothetical protein